MEPKRAPGSASLHCPLLSALIVSNPGEDETRHGETPRGSCKLRSEHTRTVHEPKEPRNGSEGTGGRGVAQAFSQGAGHLRLKPDTQD